MISKRKIAAVSFQRTWHPVWPPPHHHTGGSLGHWPLGRTRRSAWAEEGGRVDIDSVRDNRPPLDDETACHMNGILARHDGAAPIPAPNYCVFVAIGDNRFKGQAHAAGLQKSTSERESFDNLI